MTATLQKHYARVLRQWPVDVLRGITFQDSMRRRMASRFGTPGAAVDVAAETEQMNALYSLLEDRYSTAYKASDDLMRPTYNPAHYENLAKEMEEAPQRTWFQKQWLHWSRKIRLR